ncbi:MAG: BamA/TamA family outer membrane protein [Legionella sp.]|nr:BamA/TamA family outer membrane protein [Legionella sp.]
MKIVIVLFFILTSCSLFAESPQFELSGISGKVQANVKKRLQELQQNKALHDTDAMELRHQILKAMQPYGYFHPEITLQTNNKKLNISIKKGPSLHLATVTAQLIGPGSNNPKLVALVNNIPLQSGHILSMRDYNKVKLNWLSTAENLGYLHASFKKAEIFIDEANNSADISLIFDTGPLYYFGQVQFDPTYINPKLLHKFVPFHAGDPYSTKQILEFNNYLSNNGYFNSVLIKPLITDSQEVPIHVQLQPVTKYSYTLGGGYGTDTGLRGRADLHVIPVNKSGHLFNASAQGSFTQNVLQAQYLVPGFNPMVDQYTLTGNFSNLDYNSGYSNAILVSLAQQHHQDWFQRNLSLNALYEGFTYNNQPNSYQFLLYPKATFTLSQSQNKLFSPTGFTFNVNTLVASKLALSSIDMGQVSLDAKGAYMFDPLRLRLYGHLLQGLTITKDINKVPLSLALLLGGTENLKGYSYNSIGPGKVISYGGFELQKETKKNWYILGFFDAGFVDAPNINKPHLDLGLGLMWVSPIGPIKIGVAQAINNQFQRLNDTKPRLVISMGSDL